MKKWLTHCLSFVWMTNWLSLLNEWQADLQSFNWMTNWITWCLSFDWKTNSITEWLSFDWMKNWLTVFYLNNKLNNRVTVFWLNNKLTEWLSVDSMTNWITEWLSFESMINRLTYLVVSPQSLSQSIPVLIVIVNPKESFLANISFYPTTSIPWSPRYCSYDFSKFIKDEAQVDLTSGYLTQFW